MSSITMVMPPLTALVTGKSQVLKALRQYALAGLSIGPQPTTTPVDRIANVLSRFAGNQPTVFDDGVTRTPTSGVSNALERQVNRALAQVMGRSPGSTPDSFVATLNTVFPTSTNGQIITTPSRSAVSMYSPNGAPDQMAGLAAGVAGQLSAEQATLYRNASTISGDALQLVPTLTGFSPEVEMDRVNALQALVSAGIRNIVDEFGRIGEPRPNRVDYLLTVLIGPAGHVVSLGQATRLEPPDYPTTTDDEQQIASYRLLRSYTKMLRRIWNDYNTPGASLAYPLFSDRLARASVMLPVIAEANTNFQSAMDSIGYTENERRSEAAELTLIDPSGSAPPLPDMTMADFTDWIDQFSRTEGVASLADSGAFGLDNVTMQSDDLFWVFVSILAHVKTSSAVTTSVPTIVQVLSHERVTWAANDLLRQFDALADLAA